jgi:hypothetical protein
MTTEDYDKVKNDMLALKNAGIGLFIIGISTLIVAMVFPSIPWFLALVPLVGGGGLYFVSDIGMTELNMCMKQATSDKEQRN